MVISGVGSSSPRPWGCFLNVFCKVPLFVVFPTPVGVFLKAGQSEQAAARLPHARGGVSMSKGLHALDDVSSPRPWGCFPLMEVQQSDPLVFPTPVGVFPLGNENG